MKLSNAYDALDQLTAEPGHTYQYDSLHNRYACDDVSYTIDDYCQLLSDGSETYTYDGQGNLLTEREFTYIYDSLDRLIAIEGSDTRIEYTYDPFHRRLSKAEFQKGKKVNQIRYLWDGDHDIGAVTENNQLSELRVLGEGLAAEVGAAILYELKGSSYLPIHDHRGCVVALVDLKKKSCESYRYSAFGKELTGNALSPWRFASKRVDEETGLVFFGRRYYHPRQGRWITQDPEGFTDGPNLYAYLHNSPLADFDPYGLWSWRGTWDGTKKFLGGTYDFMKDSAIGMGYGLGQMGEWMHADFQYEHFNDRSFYQEKAHRSVEGWKQLGKAAKEDPLGLMVPGIMEAYRNPSDSRAWGKAFADAGLLALSASKFGRAASLGKAARLGEEAAAVGKSINTPFLKHEARPFKKIALESTVKGLMGDAYRNINEITVLIKNGSLLEKLNHSSKGDWVKVYEAGIKNGNKVEVHYFRNNATGHVFDIKLKYNYWNQKSFNK